MCDLSPRAGMLRMFAPRHTKQLEDPRHANIVVMLLKCLKNVSMEPGTVAHLAKANAIPVLSRLLGARGKLHEKVGCFSGVACLGVLL